MDPEDSLPCSQAPTIKQYPEPDESKSTPPYTIQDSYEYYLPTYIRLCLLPSGFMPKILYMQCNNPC
jgi:hypothetical protein